MENEKRKIEYNNWNSGNEKIDFLKKMNEAAVGTIISVKNSLYKILEVTDASNTILSLPDFEPRKYFKMRVFNIKQKEKIIEVHTQTFSHATPVQIARWRIGNDE